MIKRNQLVNNTISGDDDDNNNGDTELNSGIAP
jgi:hypothetical protein